MAVKSSPVAASPIGYFTEIGRWQEEHLARRQSQLMIGMFSHGRIAWPHFGQWLGGWLRDSPRGSRHTTTFMKLPMQHPRMNAIELKMPRMGAVSCAYIMLFPATVLKFAFFAVCLWYCLIIYSLFHD